MQRPRLLENGCSGCGVAPQRCVHLGLVSVALLEKGLRRCDYLRILRREPSGFRAGPESNDWCHVRGWRRHRGKQGEAR